MDPKECLRRIVTALEDCDYLEARDAIRDLIAWMDTGGFSPSADFATWHFLLSELHDRLPH